MKRCDPCRVELSCWERTGGDANACPRLSHSALSGHRWFFKYPLGRMLHQVIFLLAPGEGFNPGGVGVHEGFEGFAGRAGFNPHIIVRVDDGPCDGWA